jgi:hypothetical protein
LIKEYTDSTGVKHKIDPELYIIWLQNKIIAMKSEKRKELTIEKLLEEMTAKYLMLESTDNVESIELLEKIKLATNTLNAVNKNICNNCDCFTFEKLRDKYQFLVKQ